MRMTSSLIQPLLDTIIDQKTMMLRSGQLPNALLIDSDSQDVLQRELRGSGIIILPGLRILGLLIKDSSKPNVEVIVDDAPEPSLDRARSALDALTDEQRADLFAEYCQLCGSKKTPCTCMRDE